MKKAENAEFFENLSLWYEKLLQLASWENINRTGHLKKIDAAKLLEVTREEFCPGLTTDLDDPGAVHQLVLYSFGRYNRKKEESDTTVIRLS